MYFCKESLLRLEEDEVTLLADYLRLVVTVCRDNDRNTLVCVKERTSKEFLGITHKFQDQLSLEIWELLFEDISRMSSTVARMSQRKEEIDFYALWIAGNC